MLYLCYVYMYNVMFDCLQCSACYVQRIASGFNGMGGQSKFLIPVSYQIISNTFQVLSYADNTSHVSTFLLGSADSIVDMEIHGAVIEF